MNEIRKDFPFFDNNTSIFLDNSSTSLKPKVVIDAVNDFYIKYTANAYRGDYINSEVVSLKIDETRELVSTMLNCSSSEVIFTMNTTDSINLLCSMLRINKRHKVVSTILEHHSNILPWIENSNCYILNYKKDGMIDLKELERCLKENKVKLVSVGAVSNVTGNIQPIKEICSLVHKYNSLIHLDCCQYIPHHNIDVLDIDCDFLSFSAHKMCGPTGVGVLYGKKELLEKMKIVKYGGGMVDKVTTLNDIRYKEVPFCFEAGTPPIESIIGFGAAIRYYLSIGYEKIMNKNRELNDYFLEKIKKNNKIELLFPINKNHIPIFTINFKDRKLNIHYVAKILSDAYNISVSAGYQCAQPLYNFVNEKGGIRISLQFYNTKEEIEKFFEIIESINY